MTILAGVAGRPIAHSLSPLIHTTWIKTAELDAEYRAFGPEDGAGFAALVTDGRAGRLRGLNVTAPFKELALALADDASATARKCGSANLLLFQDGRVWAESTDGAGLIGALAEQAPELDVRGQSVVLLGAGGAARAAVAALKAAGADVGVLNRTRARAEALTADLGVTVVEARALNEAALVINALSVPPDIEVSRLRDDAVLMDMTYRPLLTPFLLQGRSRGLTTVDGLAMLIGQARPSFRVIFGIEPPPIDVRTEALTALGEAP
ncbi:shikimate dehydrogenase [Brevundimonas sp.]|uniref:shikimate dehydrogenase family protein n=1 Tax=Brevundimonas sp. TaxID=1871086 RepID=UPI00272F8B5B|nr:shikimate dehydrogenase [Brevundimonas sp.]MDP1914444.1 shikimate dehydrogenase [Brevundimonas sp.]